MSKKYDVKSAQSGNETPEKKANGIFEKESAIMIMYASTPYAQNDTMPPRAGTHENSATRKTRNIASGTTGSTKIFASTPMSEALPM